jgi:ATP-dependent Clp protease adaptor protein ClpS
VELEAMADRQQQGLLEPAQRTTPRHAPLWHVVLLDDDDHTYDYVIEMLCRLFGHAPETAYRMACDVDTVGRVVVDTTVLERAELKRDQIHAYGADRRLERSQGSMSARLEPVEG